MTTVYTTFGKDSGVGGIFTDKELAQVYLDELGEECSIIETPLAGEPKDYLHLLLRVNHDGEAQIEAFENAEEADTRILEAMDSSVPGTNFVMFLTHVPLTNALCCAEDAGLNDRLLIKHARLGFAAGSDRAAEALEILRERGGMGGPARESDA